MASKGFPLMKLGEVIALEYGASLAETARSTGRIPVLGSNGIVGSHDTPLVTGPGIVVGRKGSIGKTTWVDTDFWPIDTAYYVQPKTKHEILWLYYLLNALQLERLNSATGVPGLSRDDVYMLQAPIPSVKESRVIASALQIIDEVIEATRAVIDQTRRLKAALLQDLLTNGLPGRHTGRQPFRWLGRVPSSWRITTFAEISNVVRGSSPRPAGDSRFFNGRDVPWITVFEVTKNEDAYLSRTSECLTREGARHSRHLNSGTLVLTNSGATLGVPKLLSLDGCANDGIAAFLNIKDGISPLYLYYYLSMLTRVFRDIIAPGLGQPNLNTTLIGRTVLPLPAEDEQIAIAEAARSIDDRLFAERSRLARLQNVKSALCHGLLTGRIPVKGGS